jgi:hypothetical protein
VWNDDRDGNTEIYYAELSSSGVKLSNDVRVTNSAGVSRFPKIAWSGSDFGVLWNDQRDGTYENYFVRLNEYGLPLGPELRLTARPADSTFPAMIWNGSVYGVVYTDSRDLDPEIYFQTIDRQGTTVVPETRLTNAPGNSRSPSIAWDGRSSQYGISWLDNRSGSDQILFMRVGANGAKLTGDAPLVTLGSTQPAGQVLVHSGGEFALAWQDSAGGPNLDVYFAHLANDAFNGPKIEVTSYPAVQQSPALVWTGSQYSVAFLDSRTGTNTPFAASIGCCTATTLGDRAWSDTNRNGIQDAGEGGASGVVVALYDNAGGLLQATLTGADGTYGFSGLSCGTTYSLRFVPPAGATFSPANQGSDDTLDSDADPATGIVGLFMLSSALDATRWDAGIVACWPPDEPIYLYMVRLSTDGNKYPILDYQDPNQPGQVTGYNVYRWSTRSLPPSQWPLVATDVIDMDEGTPNKQWVDTTGDVSPTGVWYYSVSAYNHACPAEGPR